jgi:hypothetical protein
MASIMFLTMHRSASSFINASVLGPLAAELGYERLDPFLEAKRAGLHKLEVNIDPLADRRNTVLGPIRQPTQIRDVSLFDEWRKILMLRHPLDVMTSWWFYTAYGQSMNGVGVMARRLQEQRDRALELGQEGWLRFVAPKVLERYENYRLRYANRPNIRLFRYEDMIEDWRGFCSGFADAAGVDPPKAWLAQMVELGREFTPSEEQPHKHKRQVTPGDHGRKLNLEMIKELTVLFEPTLVWLGYAR